MKKINKKKTIRYNKGEYKKITGYVISPKHQLVISNKIRLKIKLILSKAEDINKIDPSLKNSLIGLTNFTRLSVKNAYKGLRKQLN